MKVLSVKNPWGFLICEGIKDVENRTWKTCYRGRILIHASRAWDCKAGEISTLFTFKQWEAIPEEIKNRMILEDLPCGAIIGEAELVDIVRDSTSVWAVPGQYHWSLKNPYLYDEPIPAKGSLGLWDY